MKRKYVTISQFAFFILQKTCAVQGLKYRAVTSDYLFWNVKDLRKRWTTGSRITLRKCIRLTKVDSLNLILPNDFTKQKYLGWSIIIVCHSSHVVYEWSSKAFTFQSLWTKYSREPGVIFSYFKPGYPDYFLVRRFLRNSHIEKWTRRLE